MRLALPPLQTSSTRSGQTFQIKSLGLPLPLPLLLLLLLLFLLLLFLLLLFLLLFLLLLWLLLLLLLLLPAREDPHRKTGQRAPVVSASAEWSPHLLSGCVHGRDVALALRWARPGENPFGPQGVAVRSNGLMAHGRKQPPPGDPTAACLSLVVLCLRVELLRALYGAYLGR